MEESTFAIRPVNPDDGEALLRLALASPDTGMIQIAPRYHIDAYQATLALISDSQTIGFVAEHSGTGEVIGSGFLSLNRIHYEGQLRDCAWLHNLQVRPDYRRQGIATRLAQHRVAQGRERVGGDGVLAASIQQGNTGSFQVAQTWSRQLAGEVKNGAVGMRQKPPRPLDHICVRTVNSEELPHIADALNNFYDGWNFYVPHSGDTLAAWLVKTPFSSPFRHYYVAEDGDGQMVAGMAIVEEYRVVEMQVKHLPLALQLLNKIVRLVPKDGRMRQLSVSKLWYAPGHLQTARYLWETLRWQWRERASTITFAYDPNSPLKEIFKTPPWIPQTSFTYAVSGPVSMSEKRLIAAG